MNVSDTASAPLFLHIPGADTIVISVFLFHSPHFLGLNPPPFSLLFNDVFPPVFLPRLFLFSQNTTNATRFLLNCISYGHFI